MHIQDQGIVVNFRIIVERNQYRKVQTQYNDISNVAMSLGVLFQYQVMAELLALTVLMLLMRFFSMLSSLSYSSTAIVPASSLSRNS